MHTKLSPSLLPLLLHSLSHALFLSHLYSGDQQAGRIASHRYGVTTQHNTYYVHVHAYLETRTNRPRVMNQMPSLLHQQNPPTHAQLPVDAPPTLPPYHHTHDTPGMYRKINRRLRRAAGRK
ncbi:uncharacterized protein IWZ02DRAFT_440752 [Phyllosticta citriasiana]|uniref:Secreted protein n=1 Tax=Phyllosticta citriasiana TaxID=595635 RepID=A0ABR1KBY6_9PEZI